MRLTDEIFQEILKELQKKGGTVAICRNEMAQEIGCVPSQISYVITSRFTPERGFLVESRRGGGGYIRITQVSMGEENPVSSWAARVGNEMDQSTALALVCNLSGAGQITSEMALILQTVLSDNVLKTVPEEFRDGMRASLLKNLLLCLGSMEGGEDNAL